MISFLSSFKINKVNPFTAFPLIFFQIYILYFKLLTNPGKCKLSLPKVIAMFVSAFFLKLPNQEPKNPPD